MTEVKPRFENYDPETAKQLMEYMSTGRGLHAYLGFRIVDIGPGTVHGQMDVREELHTPFGNLHGGVLSAFCDHLLGGVCLIVAGLQESFLPLMILMLLNGLAFMPTIALVNSVAFRHLPDPDRFPRIAVLGTIVFSGAVMRFQKRLD